ncbi:uncharacterized protein N7503_007460 [Penicillium pulvis]|uniref:uncharacterized protein n=1 Tax=Penicillium pulvis TaxID=1562058 RepID=UPI00254785DB|nr:uncharacterized protein N7503_007460 [Penicillium pulvis]KAJ5798164.1 hypothetical protein N7503_007460 [Penicillium pulvis]
MQRDVEGLNEQPMEHKLKPAIIPFAGRIGGNQDYVVDRSNPCNAELLAKVPDAAPLRTFRDGFDFRGFLDSGVWKYALVECIGTIDSPRVHPPSAPVVPHTQAGIYGTTGFLAPLIGGITNWLFLTLFIFTFSPASGGHLNPTITLGTFFARLISFPRLILYLVGQTAGGALAGLILEAAYGTRDYLVGGCFVDTQLIPVKDAFLLEFVYCLCLVFLAFGVALDPRQAGVFGPALSPWLVGLVLGLLSWGSSFTRAGYEGAALNPARCFGVYVGSRFPGYHWIHWVCLARSPPPEPQLRNERLGQS